MKIRVAKGTKKHCFMTMAIIIDRKKESTNCNSRPQLKQKWIILVSNQGNYLALNNNVKLLPKVFRQIIWCDRLMSRGACKVYENRVSSRIKISSQIKNLTHSEVSA